MAVAQFIYRNTFMNNALTALIKMSIILVSLAVGVLSYSLWEIEFDKSLFLYSSALTLDMALKILDLGKAPSNQTLIKIISFVILLITILLWGFSTIGLFGSNLVASISWLNNSKIVNLLIFVQPIWYGLETIALFIADLIRSLSKEQFAITPLCNSEYTQKNNI